MDERPPKVHRGREERIRALGFNPSFLTPQEQVDLLDIYAAAPEPQRMQGEAKPVPHYS